MKYREKLKKISLIEHKVKARCQGDYSPRPAKYQIAVVTDEVAEIYKADDPKQDLRFSVQKLLLSDGTISYRSAYHRWEGRIREGHSELRRGWGQYAPIVPSDIQERLNQQMFFKGWGPWAKMNSLMNLS